MSRRLAEQGHYPAIDIEASISRVMPQVVPADHLAKALEFKRLFSRYQQNADLIAVGAYVRGSDPQTDRAIEMLPVLQAYLQQGMTESFDLERSKQELIMSMSIPAASTNTSQGMRGGVSQGDRR